MPHRRADMGRGAFDPTRATKIVWRGVATPWRLSSAPARLAGPVYPDWQVLSTVPSQEDGARTGLQAVGVSGTLGIPTPASTTTTSRRRVRPSSMDTRSSCGGDLASDGSSD